MLDIYAILIKYQGSITFYFNNNIFPYQNNSHACMLKPVSDRFFFQTTEKRNKKKNLIHCNNDDPPIAINVFGICVSLFDTKLYVIIR